jgi:hypothetical protein
MVSIAYDDLDLGKIYWILNRYTVSNWKFDHIKFNSLIRYFLFSKTVMLTTQAVTESCEWICRSGAQKTLYSSTIALYVEVHNCDGHSQRRKYENY